MLLSALFACGCSCEILDRGDDFPDFILLNRCDVSLEIASLPNGYPVVTVEPGVDYTVYLSRPGPHRFRVTTPDGVSFEVEGPTPLTISKAACEAAAG